VELDMAYGAAGRSVSLQPALVITSTAKLRHNPRSSAFLTSETNGSTMQRLPNASRQLAFAFCPPFSIVSFHNPKSRARCSVR